MSNPELRDDPITIRPLALENAETHFLGEDEEAVKWLSSGVSTLEGVQKWILKNQEQWEHDGPVYNFGIFDSDHNLVGTIEANIDPEVVEGIELGDANISYGLYPNARGKGYMKKALGLMERFLKGKGIKKTVIRVAPDNFNSLKVPKQYGYREIDVIKTKDNHQLVRFIKILND